MGRKKSKGEGFTRTQKQWEKSIADHVGKFIDRLTFTDVLNMIGFASTAYGAYKGIKFIEGIELPDWLKWLSPLSPFLWQLLIPIEAVEAMSEQDKIILSLVAGYSAIKLAPVVVEATMKAAIPT